MHVPIENLPRFKREGIQREWGESPGIKTISQYVKFPMELPEAESARYLAANNLRGWKNKKRVKGKARAAMMSRKNAKGRSLGRIPDLLIVPPALEGMARDILLADFISGTKNAMVATAELHVEPRLKSDTAWFLLSTKRSIKPLIYQQRNYLENACPKYRRQV